MEMLILAVITVFALKVYKPFYKVANMFGFY